MSSVNSQIQDRTLSLPRIMCLHGGGTNAKIFRMQCRALIAQLKSEFRFVFAEAPFISEAGPDVMSVYNQMGPFKRWLRWKQEHPDIESERVLRELDECLENTKLQDNELGGTGEWVALLGFSQGAKLCASLLYRQQVRAQKYGKHVAIQEYRFGILFAGRGPLLSLDPTLTLSPALPDVSQITDYTQNVHSQGHILRIPTIHVHGTCDPGLDFHRQLFEKLCARESRRLIEWNGEHRMPWKSNDVLLVADAIRALAKQENIAA
ncbi:alpha/beta-Hydrolase [Glarea lozoyensis ATCC 20868]|uniref:Alpha/beta-Hydrolase n=1 Tax=Glarea lozoyensis (strain ATCC 20868 / MF5171) TaxID=1116229 RepID=S3CT74_GLAL2|nr:alpha/beta-Hydrolase [Glarea lozoyensis ATCC 20868]EPE28835.1 alpha/beta-Hydrolase [Glarea lozoyensis ATCC 20868]